MKQSVIITLVGIASVIIIAFGIFFYGIGVNREEIRLRELAGAEIENLESVHDQMWKTLSQKAQVTDEYRDAFGDIYKDIISGRYSQGDGSMMKWIQESNPQFNEGLYQDLMTSIEVLRGKFAEHQKKVLDIKREHNILRRDPIKSYFLTDTSEIVYEVISSAVSKKVIETREDNDIKLFGR